MMELQDITESDLAGYLFVNGDTFTDLKRLRIQLETEIFDVWADNCRDAQGYCPVPEDNPVISPYYLYAIECRKQRKARENLSDKEIQRIIRQRHGSRFDFSPRDWQPE